jgi:lipopolysaccharide transport system ATP-binding protein
MLRVNNLGKSYKIYPGPRARLRELVTGRPCHEEYWALRDADFEVRPGESVGIIGNNGAGKSTLLKLIAGTIQPSRGDVAYEGRLTAILELATGFHPEFTGRENIFFAGTLMGIGEAELKGRYDEILAFSELEKVIGRPVKTYSSGMVMRLAFSLVTAVQPDILIIDEALAVGDRTFQQKCIQRMKDIQASGATILFCSHSMHHITQFCSRALWVDQGQVREDAEAREVVSHYVASSIPEGTPVGSGPVAARTAEPAKLGKHRCVVTEVRLLSPRLPVKRGQAMSIEIRFNVREPGEFVFGVAIDRADTNLRLVAETSLESRLPPVVLERGSHVVQLGIATDCFRAGTYLIKAGLLDTTLLQIEDYQTLEVKLEDIDDIQSPALVRTGIAWDTNGTFFPVEPGR